LGLVSAVSRFNLPPTNKKKINNNSGILIIGMKGNLAQDQRGNLIARKKLKQFIDQFSQEVIYLS
jgi:hypothetical protein